jgi:hypothetical protein
MNATKEATCEERIESHLEALEADITDVLNAYYNGEEDGFEAWNNYPLAVATHQITRIELSWGGPSDFLTVEHEGTEIIRVSYYFQDWFDGAVRPVQEGSKVWDYARTVIEAREGF